MMTQWFWTWKRAVLSCVLTLILLAIVVPITVHFTHHPDVSPAPPEPTTSVPLEIPDSSAEDNNGTDTSFRIVERDEWGAQPASRPLIKMKLPVSYVIIGRSQGTPSHYCTTQSECTTKVRATQAYYLENKFDDIGYSFFVGGDGLAYVGRNWDYVGQHACGYYNNKSIGINFIGNFSSVVPSKLQIRAARKIIELGVKDGKITPDYKLLDQQVWNAGDNLYNEIIKWPHYSCEDGPDSSCKSKCPITVHFTYHPSDVSLAPPELTTPVPSEIPDSSTEDNNGTDTSFRIVERDEWGAQPASRPLIKMKLPVPYVIIGRSQGTFIVTPSHYCTTQLECTIKVRLIQAWYLENKFDDTGYSFFVGGDGLAYVGRNWDYVGQHARGYNDRSIGICFIGNFSSVVPSKLQIRAARKIIELGVKTGKITPDYKLLDRQPWDTGDNLYNEIIKWPHWSSEP
ncbi:peptidoglycan recognition protein 3-like isoform X2 [Temnothorax longispinosus]|uniref:peptidoglycan recognition protein 3-like isoform X2 n=2 Tax=Temnothorax longispinosus TaxID=300112 RepID=UPI003A98DF16